MNLEVNKALNSNLYFSHNIKYYNQSFFHATHAFSS